MKVEDFVESLVERSVNNQCEHGCISKDEKEVYIYGYTLLVNAFINIITAILIGIIFQEVLFVLIFHIIFIPLRIYSGGWHASSVLKCTICSNVIIITALVLYKYRVFGIDDRLLGLLDILFVFYLLKNKITECKGRKLSDGEMKKYHRILSIQLIIHLFAMILLLYMGCTDAVYVFLVAHGVQEILVCMRKYECSHTDS